MTACPAIDDPGEWQGRAVRRMMVLSVAVHAAVIILGPAASSLFPSRVDPVPVFVELTSLPMSELPEESPAPPLPVPPAVASADSSVSARSPAKPPPAARRWLDKLDAGAAKLPEAPVARKEGKAGGIPVRQWANEGHARPHDFAPAVAPERAVAMGKHLEDLEARVRHSGRPSVGFGRETEASMMFGGTGDATGEPIPAWIRDLIRKRVRGYLPELEGMYTEAIRRNPDLRGKLLVRFRIDPSGRIQRAESVEESFRDAVFVNAVLERVRGWTFDPTVGRTVEVLYPFVFITPS
jgi:TonB family protein